MEWRIAQLESQVYRLRADIQTLETAFWLLQDREREKSVNRAYFALFVVVNAVLLGALSAGFGWI